MNAISVRPEGKRSVTQRDCRFTGDSSDVHKLDNGMHKPEIFMNLAVLAIALLVSPQDTGRIETRPDSSPPDSLVDLSPTVAHRSLLGSATLDLPDAGGPESTAGVGDSTRRRPRAVEYSDAYYSRLKVHRIASYLTVPLFVAQYFAGQALWNNPQSHGLARDVHGPLAVGIGGLFTVNTVTGVWNLIESRHNPDGRTRRWIHGLTMIAADAGFVVVGAVTPHRQREIGGVAPPPVPIASRSGATTHRNLAIGSMGLALGSYLMMILWKG